MQISVIMPCQILDQELFNLTQTAVLSLKGAWYYNPLIGGEVIIIDNNSEIGGGYLRQEADIYIKNSKNIGYPASINQALALAHYDCLVIANNDIWVTPNWVNVVKEIFNKDEKVGSVHFRMIDYDKPFGYGDNMWITGKERWCTSSFFVIKKEAMIKYDENYGLGGYDDWSLWHQIRHINGWKTAYTDKVCYKHAHSTTQNKRDPKEREKSDRRNREYFKSKFGKYPEEIWNEKYPDQMVANYFDFFETL